MKERTHTPAALNLEATSNNHPVDGMNPYLAATKTPFASMGPDRYPVYSPAELSARWATWIDPNKNPATCDWSQGPYGVALDWGRPIDYAKYGGSAKDKAKYGPRQKPTKAEVEAAKKYLDKVEAKCQALLSVENRVSSESTGSNSSSSSGHSSNSSRTSTSSTASTKKYTPEQLEAAQRRLASKKKDQQAENVKYYHILNIKINDNSAYATAHLTQPVQKPTFNPKRKLKLNRKQKQKQPPLKPALKPTYGNTQATKTKKHAHFSNYHQVRILEEQPEHPEQPEQPEQPIYQVDSKLRQQTLKLGTHLFSSLPSPRCLKARTIVATKVANRKLKNVFTSTSIDGEWKPRPPPKDTDRTTANLRGKGKGQGEGRTSSDLPSFRPEHVFGASEGRARLHKRTASRIPVRTMK